MEKPVEIPQIQNQWKYLKFKPILQVQELTVVPYRVPLSPVQDWLHQKIRKNNRCLLPFIFQWIYDEEREILQLKSVSPTYPLK